MSVCFGLFSQVTKRQAHSHMLNQSCLASDRESLCVHAWFAFLFVCLFACLFVSRGFSGEIQIYCTSMAQLLSVCLGYSAPHQCPCVWFVTAQCSLYKALLPFSLVTLCKILFQPIRRFIYTGSEIWTHQGQNLQLQIEIHNSRRCRYTGSAKQWPCWFVFWDFFGYLLSSLFSSDTVKTTIK